MTFYIDILSWKFDLHIFALILLLDYYSKPAVLQYFNSLIYEGTTYYFIGLTMAGYEIYEDEKEELKNRILTNNNLAAQCPCEMLWSEKCGK